MYIRELTPEDIDAHSRVSAMAFHWSYTKGEETFPENERILGCFDDGGTLLADLEFSVRKAVVGETTLPVTCIGGVASLPFARRQGAVRRLFVEMEHMAAREGWALGALYPFSTEYYRKFGYEATLRELSITVPMRHLDSLAAAVAPEEQGSVELVEGERGVPELLAIYNDVARQHQLMPLREDAGYFRTNPMEDRAYTCLWRDAQGEAQGYVTYHLNMESHNLDVREIGFLTPEALRGLLCYLRVYNKAKAVCFGSVPLDSPLLLALREYSDMTATHRFSASYRLFDPVAVLRARQYPRQHGAFAMAIKGDTMEHCNATYVVEYANGSAEVDVLPNDVPAALTLTREAAARLLLGGQTWTPFALRFCPGVALGEGEAAQSEVEDFLRAFGTTPTAMWDGF